MKQIELNHLLIYQERKLIEYKPEKAVHYCNFDTFNKIITPFVQGDTMERIDGKTFLPYKAKYITFFATDINYLNDREEYNIGKKNVESVAGALANDSEELFVACFCDKTDNLTQWKYYGKNAGLAVEFDTEGVSINYCDNCKCKKIGKKNEYPQHHDIRFMPFNVFYCVRADEANPDEKREIRRRIKKMLPDEYELSSITEQTAKLGIIPYIKHEAFEDERESRIILYHSGHGKKRCSSTKYRTANMIKPYLEMRMFYGSEVAKKHIPIKSVTVGPCPEPNLLIRSIYHSLEEDLVKRERYISDDEINRHGYVKTSGGIKIYKSTVPFRSY